MTPVSGAFQASREADSARTCVCCGSDIVDVFLSVAFAFPSVFARLAYCASLGKMALEPCYPANKVRAGKNDTVKCSLRSYHLETFLFWLRLPASQQKDDLKVFVNTVEEGPYSALLGYLQRDSHDGLVPENALDGERSLFLKDLDELITLVTARL